MAEKNMDKKLDDLINKINNAKKSEKLDLSSDQDLSIAIMNLVSIEEHFFFTYAKTNKEKYLDLLQEVREIRKSLLKKIVKNPEGEEWCISKHLLAATMRLMEVGTKQLSLGRKSEAKDFFDKAYKIYTLFWAVNMGLIDTKNIKKIEDGALNNQDNSDKGVFGKLGAVIKKAIDCCIE
jgi:tetratricopeptide (TPR) repeat protein